MKPMLAPGTYSRAHVMFCAWRHRKPHSPAPMAVPLGYGVGSGKVNIDVTAVDHESNFLHHFGAIGIPIEGAVLKGSALIRTWIRSPSAWRKQSPRRSRPHFRCPCRRCKPVPCRWPLPFRRHHKNLAANGCSQDRHQPRLARQCCRCSRPWTVDAGSVYVPVGPRHDGSGSGIPYGVPTLHCSAA